jgi:hypothetical protein
MLASRDQTCRGIGCRVLDPDGDIHWTSPTEHIDTGPAGGARADAPVCADGRRRSVTKA